MKASVLILLLLTGLGGVLPAADAPASMDRKPVTAATTKGRERKVSLTLSAAEAQLQPAGLRRLWLAGGDYFDALVACNRFIASA